MSESLETRANPEIDDDPTPPEGSYRIRLSSADDVRVEMAKVYREMRRKSLPMKDGNGLIYALGQLGRQVQASVTEAELAALRAEIETMKGK